MIASKVVGSTYQPMTLLFTKDAEVIPASGVTEFTTYTIKAGSYYIDDSNVDSVATGGVVNLYTSKAKSFFTNVENIGYYYVTATGLDGKEIQGKDLNGNEVKKVSNGDDWRVNDDFKTGASSQSGYVNFAASEGSFTKYPSRYAYESDKGIFFRWESTSPLYLSSTVKLVGSEFKFANMGVLDGTQTRTPHFYLISNDVSQNSMYVEFRTDFYVKYIDDKGYKRQFAIREGKYEIRKPKDDEDRSYIADLFDYEYLSTEDWHFLPLHHYFCVELPQFPHMLPPPVLHCCRSVEASISVPQKALVVCLTLDWTRSRLLLELKPVLYTSPTHKHKAYALRPPKTTKYALPKRSRAKA